jgi:type VI protein secretion system component VasK
VYQPDFMAVYVLDDKTKDTVLKQFDELELEGKEHIVESLTAEPTDKQRSNIREFLKEFTRRRPNLDVTIYPNEFLDWMDYVV